MVEEGRVCIIYIAGYGRSGSTLLDAILSNLALAKGLGEVGRLPHCLQSPRLGCSCGSSYQNCPIWSAIIKEVGVDRLQEGRRLSRTVESIVSPILRWRGEKAYCALWREIFQARNRLTAGGIFIDSSKTAYDYAFRPVALSRCAWAEVHVVHLIRPLNRVLESRGKGKNVELATGERRFLSRFLWRSRTVLGWLLANGLAAYLRRVPTIASYQTVRFDDLTKHPIEIGSKLLENISKKSYKQIDIVDVDPSKLKVFHLVEGNRIARRGMVSVDGSRAQSKQGCQSRHG